MKIFCIGLSKTATTSLTDALTILGFKAVHWPDTRHMIHYTNDGLEIDFDTFERYDAFADTPIAMIYKELDLKYPGSKFILTVRDVSRWSQSFKDQFGKGWLDPFSEKLHIDLYGTSSYDEKKCVSAFKKHSQDVINYFRGREEDLLIMDITAGNGWSKLCPFLDLSIPGVTFPTRYTREERKAKRERKAPIVARLGFLLKNPAQIPGKMKLLFNTLLRNG